MATGLSARKQHLACSPLLLRHIHAYYGVFRVRSLAWLSLVDGSIQETKLLNIKQQISKWRMDIELMGKC